MQPTSGFSPYPQRPQTLQGSNPSYMTQSQFQLGNPMMRTQTGYNWNRVGMPNQPNLTFNRPAPPPPSPWGMITSAYNPSFYGRGGGSGGNDQGGM